MNLFTSKSEPALENDDKFFRHKRITTDEGKNSVGLNERTVGNENDIGRYDDAEEKHIAEESDFKKLKVRSLNENQKETKILEKRVTLRKRNSSASDQHTRSERSRSFEKVNSREEKEMSSIKTLSSQSVPVEKQKLEISGSGEEEETPVSLGK